MPVSTYDRIDASLQRLLTITAPTAPAQNGRLCYKASATPVTALSGNAIGGYCAVWKDNTGQPYVDSYNDMTVPGSWQDTIQAAYRERKATGRPHLMPYLHNHQANTQLGGVIALYEDSRGVAYESKLAATDKAREIYQLAKDGFLGTSYGYYPVQASHMRHGGKSVRVLHKVDVMEISAVTHPANPYATAYAKARRQPPTGQQFRSAFPPRRSMWDDVPQAYLSPDGRVKLERALLDIRHDWQQSADRIARIQRMAERREQLGRLADRLEDFINSVQ